MNFNRHTLDVKELNISLLIILLLIRSVNSIKYLKIKALSGVFLISKYLDIMLLNRSKGETMKLIILFSLFFGIAVFAKDNCDDKQSIYKICSKQNDLFENAKKDALKSNKNMLVVFGFENCPWCKALHSKLKSKEFIKNFAKEIQYIDIALYDNKNDKVDEGHKILKGLLKKSQNKVEVEGSPFLVFFNPKTEKVFLQNSGELEENTKSSKGHSSKKLKSAMNNALSKI